jgi:uncharacterized flavoprotein (TIGR03862 family)
MLNPELSPRQIAIIGGGPAGLIAAETLAGLGHKVTIYDRMASLGRKFLLAGRGGLNLTHSEPHDAFVARYGAGKDWMAAMLAHFSPDDLQAWAQGLGQELFVGSSGRVFPKAMKASPLLRAWLARLDALGVKVNLGARWLGWDNYGALIFDGLEPVTADATILAMGGGSWGKLGSDGAWVNALEDKSVTIAPLQASNCGITLNWTPHLSERFAGAPIKAVSVTCGDMSARGDIVITKTGLEGGAIYALSPALRAGLESGDCTLSIDLRPDAEVRTIAEKLVKSKAGQSLSSALKGQARLSPAAIGLMREACDNKLPTTAMGLARLIKTVSLKVSGLAGIDRAISTAGGISADALDDNLMVKAMPGVFAAGEMLDWDGPTGGYLLQACFASGKQAAMGADTYLRTQSQETVYADGSQ